MEGLERVERLLAMILLHDLTDAPQSLRAVALSRAGFGNAEIAEMLGTTSNVIAQQLYHARGTGQRGAKRAKKTRR
ncbi:MAG: hypothetical protein ACREC3_14200 [Methyloceanibacter sp.]